MKKIVSILLIISSLFTLSSSIASCATSEVSEISEVESSNETKYVSEKIIAKENQRKRNERIKQFLVEKGNYFPENKLMDIKSLLHTLKDDELEIVLNVNFKKPGYVTLAAALGGFVGLDSLMLNDSNGGLSMLKNIGCTFLLEFLRHACESEMVFTSFLKNKDNLTVLRYGCNILSVFTVGMSIRVICDWVKNIFTASIRTKEYNYQLLINATGKE